MKATLLMIAMISLNAQAIDLEPGTWNCYYQDMGYVFTDETNRPREGFAGFSGEMSAQGCPTELSVPYQSQDYLLDLISDTERNIRTSL